MKLGVISDVHGNLPALHAVTTALNDDYEIDSLVCAGDVVGVLGDTGAVAEYIKEHAAHTVIGNHDLRISPHRDWMPVHDFEVVEYETSMGDISDDAYDWLINLPGMVETDEYVIAHSRPDPSAPSGTKKGDAGVHTKDFTSVATSLGDTILILGHTHYQHAVRLDKFEGQSGLVLNPGSVGFPFAHERTVDDDGNVTHTGKAAFAVVDTETHEYELCSVTYDSTPIVDFLASHDLFDNPREATSTGKGSMRDHSRP